ncbi:MAG: GlsB/YeaQ/YmgE family stress response membrane protein [Polyangiales bacterium]
MGILTWIGVGLVAGVLAKWIMPGTQGGGFIMTTVLGVIGGLVGGFGANQLGVGDITGFNLTTVLTATAGAIVTLLIYGFIKKRT